MAKPNVMDTPAEERAQFAREQMEFLLEKGLSPKTAARVMKEAGPGQVRLAWDYVEAVHARVTPTLARVDAVDMALTGLGGSTGFGRERTLKALVELGLGGGNFPQELWSELWGLSSNRLMGVLRGAREINWWWMILSPGLKAQRAEERRRHEAWDLFRRVFPGTGDLGDPRDPDEALEDFPTRALLHRALSDRAEADASVLGLFSLEEATGLLWDLISAA